MWIWRYTEILASTNLKKIYEGAVFFLGGGGLYGRHVVVYAECQKCLLDLGISIKGGGEPMIFYWWGFGGRNPRFPQPLYNSLGGRG